MLIKNMLLRRKWLQRMPYYEDKDGKEKPAKKKKK
jgi:hypothetical protein